MATSVMDGTSMRGARVARANREGVKVCPRCGAKTFADMDICYGCLYDFTTGEGEVSLEGIRHENDQEPRSPLGSLRGLDEPDFHQLDKAVAGGCASDVAELFSCPPDNGSVLRPTRVHEEEPLAVSGGKMPVEPGLGAGRARVAPVSASASGKGGGVPRRECRCDEDAPCIRVIASDIPVVVEVMGPNVTVRQLWQGGHSFGVCAETKNDCRVDGESLSLAACAHDEGETGSAPISNGERARMGSQSSDGDAQ